MVSSNPFASAYPLSFSVICNTSVAIRFFSLSTRFPFKRTCLSFLNIDQVFLFIFRITKFQDLTKKGGEKEDKWSPQIITFTQSQPNAGQPKQPDLPLPSTHKVIARCQKGVDIRNGAPDPLQKRCFSRGERKKGADMSKRHLSLFFFQFDENLRFLIQAHSHSMVPPQLTLD